MNTLQTSARHPVWQYYPPGWPKCWFCDLPAMDGHLTCGRLTCPEHDARLAQIQKAASS